MDIAVHFLFLFFFKEKTNKIPLRLLLCACTRLLFLSLCGVIPRRVSEIAFVSLRAPSSLSLRAVSTDPHWFNNFAFCSVLIFYPPVLWLWVTVFVCLWCSLEALRLFITFEHSDTWTVRSLVFVSCTMSSPVSSFFFSAFCFFAPFLFLEAHWKPNHFAMEMMMERSSSFIPLSSTETPCPALTDTVSIASWCVVSCIKWLVGNTPSLSVHLAFWRYFFPTNSLRKCWWLSGVKRLDLSKWNGVCGRPRCSAIFTICVIDWTSNRTKKWMMTPTASALYIA